MYIGTAFGSGTHLNAVRWPVLTIFLDTVGRLRLCPTYRNCCIRSVLLSRGGKVITNHEFGDRVGERRIVIPALPNTYSTWATSRSSSWGGRRWWRRWRRWGRITVIIRLAGWCWRTGERKRGSWEWWQCHTRCGRIMTHRNSSSNSCHATRCAMLTGIVSTILSVSYSHSITLAVLWIHSFLSFTFIIFLIIVFVNDSIVVVIVWSWDCVDRLSISR